MQPVRAAATVNAQTAEMNRFMFNIKGEAYRTANNG
jgi:hypothetical protein